jgi:hypothetical protein
MVAASQLEITAKRLLKQRETRLRPPHLSELVFESCADLLNKNFIVCLLCRVNDMSSVAGKALSAHTTA